MWSIESRASGRLSSSMSMQQFGLGMDNDKNDEMSKQRGQGQHLQHPFVVWRSPRQEQEGSAAVPSCPQHLHPLHKQLSSTDKDRQKGPFNISVNVIVRHIHYTLYIFVANYQRPQAVAEALQHASVKHAAAVKAASPDKQQQKMDKMGDYCRCGIPDQAACGTCGLEYVQRAARDAAARAARDAAAEVTEVPLPLSAPPLADAAAEVTEVPLPLSAPPLALVAQASTEKEIVRKRTPRDCFRFEFCKIRKEIGRPLNPASKEFWNAFKPEWERVQQDPNKMAALTTEAEATGWVAKQGRRRRAEKAQD